jgi:hypothetical protein
MKKRLTMALAVGALVAAMVPGVTSAAPPQVTGSIESFYCPTPGEFTGTPSDVIPAILTELRGLNANPACRARAEVTINGHTLYLR